MGLRVAQVMEEPASAVREGDTLERVEDDYARAKDKAACEIMVSGTAWIDAEAALSEALPSLRCGHSLLVVRAGRQALA